MDEKTQILKCAGNSSISNGVGGKPQQTFPLKQNFALIRFVNARYAVKQSGLAGSVGPDNGQDFFPLQRQADTGQRLDAAEADQQPLNLQ